MKVVLAILTVGLVGAVLLIMHLKNSPPSETAIIDDFRAHKSAFEELKESLQTDSQLDRIAAWGVVTTKSPVPQRPPEGDFPSQRFKQYLSLLNEVHGLGASRSRGPQPELCVLVWASGWAADTKHIAVCWSEKVPLNQLSNIDDLKQTSSPRNVQRQFRYKEIEGNWFLRKDW